MTVWTLYKAISRRLLVWSGLSIVTGLLFILLGGAFWQGVGIQSSAWGAVDGIIALVGKRVAERRRSARDGQAKDRSNEQEAHRLARLLRVNAGLDVVYVSTGVGMAIWPGASRSKWRGHGWGVIVQGAFLLIFDLAHAQIADRLCSQRTAPQA
jgi:hypothetical protein